MPASAASTESVGGRYAATVGALIDEAVENESGQVLADVLSRGLARMMVGYRSSAVMGDVLRLLGDHMNAIGQRRDALEQAARAREEGRMPS